MEYAKDEIFNLRYNETLNRLEFGKERWTSRVLKKIKKHKFILLILTLIFIFSILDVVLICEFMKMLQNVWFF